ncbi:TetR/AcrR family transcriptional regulator [Brooklawnia sp.]|uniref:TetR/AcrR family transcriptional regulator n=1 Tax=Brooklawnia sp. TaxID=2699740 RepID=UPI00311F557E
MAARISQVTASRQERRKEATRAKIQAAAEDLFDARGYADTSIEDISQAADVAVRTIYLHFGSKAAIMLAYFDDWMDVFVAEIIQRPPDEPVVDTTEAALHAMNEAGWTDRVENTDLKVHPIVEHLYDGAPDIAGYVVQRWMREIDRLSDDAALRGEYPAGSLEPRARAVAVFSGWISAMIAGHCRGREPGLPATSDRGQGLEVLALLTRGGI